ncbi:hypothetical protein HK103_000594 [Boothiomyces macroporosus]|uniref:E3 ubiquitin ligase complex SCF subunit n=1 Tax=Boothiomyces macroporosus TaxID=261099 RepID=A0AAD5UN14_9FUNG|nr:hypothetical protein HK103_000594 [Boothiomyces macroporosus]
MAFDPQTQVKLKTSDEVEYILQKDVVTQSHLIKNMLMDLDISDAVPFIDKVIQYCKMHKDDPIPEEPLLYKSLDDISEEDSKLVKVDNQTLFDIITAANYLDIPGLLDLGCKTVALLLKGKTIDEVIKEFNVPPERWYTPEQRKLIEEV